MQAQNPYQHTVASLSQLLLEEITSTIFRSIKESGLQVCVDGVLGEIKPTEYQMHYGVRLSDSSKYVLLDIPRDLCTFSKVKSGDYVSVTGQIKPVMDNYTQNLLQLRLHVSSIRCTDSPETVNLQRQDLASIVRIKSLNSGHHAFPLKEILSIDVLTSKGSEVKQDFMYELYKLDSAVNIAFYPVSMTSKDDLANYIAASHADILVIIRGGGDYSQFDVFDSMQILESLSKSPCYRIVGLGHSSNATLCDLISDFSANTPAQAGVHIRENYLSYHSKINSMKETITNMDTKMQSLTEQLALAQIKAFDLMHAVSTHRKPLLLTALFFLVVGAFLTFKFM